MSLPEILRGRLSVPVIASPMFILSVPDLVLAQCKAGVVGSFPSLNARPKEALEEWFKRITDELGDWDAANPVQKAAPYAVNLIVHRSNERLLHDLELCVKYKAPIVITSCCMT
jgi:nitronate monooxygenase